MTQLARATLTPTTDSEGRSRDGLTPLTVQFNPETLEVTARAKLQEEKGEKQDKAPVQVVGGTERSLSVQLIFDQTDTGADVRNQTTLIQAMMQTGDAVLQGYGKNNSDKTVKVPQVALFEWGNFSFRGVISECNETLEYFSADGVPLRASVKFSMQERNAAFGATNGADSSAPVNGGLSLPPDTPLPANAPVQNATKKNGVENFRLPETDEVFTEPSENGDEGGAVRGALGNFSASAQASGAGGAFSAGASAGFGAGAGGGAGFGAGAGVQFGLPAAPIATGSMGAGFGLDAGLDVSAGLDFGVSIGGGAGAGLDMGGGIDLGADLSVEAGLSAFAGLNAGGGAGAGLSGLSELKDMASAFDPDKAVDSFANSETGVDENGIFTAKAEVGAKVDLAQLLFGEDGP